MGLPNTQSGIVRISNILERTPGCAHARVSAVDTSLLGAGVGSGLRKGENSFVCCGLGWVGDVLKRQGERCVGFEIAN